MPPDSYLVEVLHYLNPHLIWIEVVDPSVARGDQFVFEQIGLYGVLPVELTLDLVDDSLKTDLSDKWLPAACVILKKALAGAKEVWFCPTYIDRRSSIFDDNIHKYGEILVKRHDKLKPLSKILIKAGIASYDICLFHQQLSLGKFKTKLKSLESQAVIKEIENYYEKKNVSKKHWEKSVKEQTTVTHATQILESELTTINLKKHNNIMSQLLQNKINDFELCRDINEEPVGKGYRVKQQNVLEETKSKETLTTSNHVKPHVSAIISGKKLVSMTKKSSIPNVDNDLKNDPEQILGYAKKFLDLNVSRYIGEQGIQETTSKNYKEKPSEANIYYNGQKYNNEDKNKKGLKLPKTSMKKNCTSRERTVCYGPPGISCTTLLITTMAENIEKQQSSRLQCQEKIVEKEDMFANLDSALNFEITNKNSLINTHHKYVDAPKKSNFRLNDSSKGNNSYNHSIADGVDSCSEVTVTSSNLLLQKKLMLYKKKKTQILNSSITSCSETSNKDSSSGVEEVNVKKTDDKKQIRNTDDEEVVRKINEEYSTPNVCKELNHNNASADYDISMKNSVNPFKNVDPNISIFVDKLVTPILMVHTKMNKRIEPVFNLRDVNFNAHIQMVLKTMSMESPMMLQTISWFCILRGYSTFMISPVGSGKTMGYLPAVCRLINDINAEDSESVGPVCIIVCATAKAVGEVEKLSKMFLGVRDKVVSCFAGVDETLVTTSLLNGCGLLISTPSYLVRLLQVTDFGVDLRRLATLVLDDCERLGEVYGNELKYIMLKMKENLKNRNKELKLQYVIASRIWCDFMEPMVKKAPYSVVCIGAFQECVLYSKAGMSVNFVQQNSKEQAVHDFLTQIDITKRTVIICDTDDEIFVLKKALKGKYKNTVFTCDSSMTIQNLYNLRVSWDEYEEPLLGPILLCCNDTLAHMNVTDAHYLLIYSLPPLFSTFCRWFSVLNDKYPSIFKSDNEVVKIKILIEEKNLAQLPKILNFIRRCTDNIPQHLNDVCNNIMVQKDKAKATKLITLCDNLLSLGLCPDYWNCHVRHTVVEDVDKVKKWMPIKGQITFKILHYHSAVHYSARLLSNTANDTTYKYPHTYSTLSLKMGMYYSKDSNKKPHGIPNIGDVCAVSLKQSFFVRCQVIKILSKYQKGNPNNVLIKLLDEEKIENTRDIYLYHIPEELKNIETHVVQVRLANIQPKDKDVTFSNLAKNHLKSITDNDDDLYMRGEVAMSVGNCIFVDSLEACQDLASINQTVVKHDFKSDLLEKHAIPNMEHLNKIKELCDGKLQVKEETETHKSLESVTTVTSGSWAYIDDDNLVLVYFTSAISPYKFYVRLKKFESCFNMLWKEIQKFVAENPKPVDKVKEGDIVLAMFPDDGTFERARIDGVVDKYKVKCFFVDQGDWREVSNYNLFAIKDEFVTKMPFQAIECRLLGIKPAGDEWTDFATNWFADISFDDNSENMKSLYVKYFTKEKAESTGGNKYGIVMIDTNSDQDVIINQLLIDVNLAKEDSSEIEYLNELQTLNASKSSSNEHISVAQEEEEEKEGHKSIETCEGENIQTNTTTVLDTIMKQPIRSVPLVGSDGEDSDDSDRWNINMAHDFLKIFSPNTNDSTKVKSLPAIMNKSEDAVTAPEGNSIISLKVKSRNETKDLDSDDYSSPESSVILNTPKKHVIKSLLVTNNVRKPKLVWRQNKKIVFIKIQLIGLQMYDVRIGGRSISFAANLNDVDYAFDIELYGVIDVMKSQHCNKGQYVLVKLHKILNKNWLTLTKDEEVRKWIVYDVESIDVSSDEEVIDEHNKSTMLNAIKNIYNREETESEDEDFVGDLNY